MNLFPIECKGKDGKDIYPHTDYVTLSTYSVARVDLKNANSIDIIFLDGEWIKTKILEGKIKIKHEYDPLFDAFIITASSEEMNMFLEKYGDDKRIYDKEHMKLNKVKDNLYAAKNLMDK